MDLLLCLERVKRNPLPGEAGGEVANRLWAIQCVQRKVGGADQVLRTSQEVWGMGLMGLGGLIAIVGGLLFLVIVLRATRNRTGATA